MRKFFTVVAAALLALSALAQPKEIHIVSANDIHAKITAFPQLGAVLDSLRAAYPGLLVISAGDNRTGDPFNDMYEIPAYPMVALMNLVGFHATTLGNHEFDSGAEGLARLTAMSGFHYLCCNIFPDPELHMDVRPYEVFDVMGTKVAFLGVVQVGENGLPDSHPDNCKGLRFTPVLETVQQYSWLRDACDVVVLLSHIGYEDDVAISAQLPWVDLIIGGHSHTQLAGGELHNGILITQNVNKLARVTHTTLTLENGRLTDKKAETIEVASHPRKNAVVDELVRVFCDNPYFRRELCTIAAPFTSPQELGSMMADAWKAETGADVAFINAGGIRFNEFPAGPFTVTDALSLDPFGNDCVELQLSGKELKDMLIACCNADGYGFPSVSGIRCTVYFKKDDPAHPTGADIVLDDGRKLDPGQMYKVVTNSYVVAVSVCDHQDPGRSINRKTADLIMDYLQGQGSIDYTGVNRVTQVHK